MRRRFGARSSRYPSEHVEHDRWIDPFDEFDLADGKLVRHTQKTRAGMTKSYLLTCFAKYFNGDSAPTKALSELVFNAREEKTSERIVCRKKK